MADYAKWDKLVDSDEEEEEKRHQLLRDMRCNDRSDLGREQEIVEKWLKKQEAEMAREAGRPRREPAPPPPPSYPSFEPAGGLGMLGSAFGLGGSSSGGAAGFSPTPMLPRPAPRPYRKVTKEERKVLAMLCVLSHFEAGQTNLDRHPQMLDLIRHNTWLEEDPGSLELLCRVHNHAMRLTGAGTDEGATRPMAGSTESKEDARVRAMCFSGVNTLSAPKECKCPGGVLEVLTLICTPETDRARECRVKWQRKEFAKDALFASLFPDVHDMGESPDSWTETWVFVGLFVVLAAMSFFLFYGPLMVGPDAPSKKLAEGAAAAVSSSVAAAVAGAAPSAAAGLANVATGAAAGAAAAAATAAGGAVPPPGSAAAYAAMSTAESQRKIEELQRQIEELKRNHAGELPSLGGAAASAKASADKQASAAIFSEEL